MELSDWGTVSDIFQSVLTGLAIIIGGIWTYKKFIKKREAYPRASLKHNIVEKKLTDDKRLLHLCIEVQNISDVLLQLVLCDIRIYQIMPLSDELAQAVSKGENPVPDRQGEIPWPVLYEVERNWDIGTYELEPQETEVFEFDFIVDKSVRTIQAYSYFKNISKAEREIGWHCTVFHDLS